MYGTDIRYEEDGKFIDYDPSLKKVSKKQKVKLKNIAKDSGIFEKEEADNYSYVNASGDAKQYFPKNLYENAGIVLEKDNYAIAFTPVILFIVVSLPMNMAVTENFWLLICIWLLNTGM